MGIGRGTSDSLDAYCMKGPVMIDHTKGVTEKSSSVSAGSVYRQSPWAALTCLEA